MSAQDEPGGEWEDHPPPEGADSMRLRWRREESGRWVITDLCLRAQALTAGMLRAISLPLLEARRNSDAAGIAAWEMAASLPRRERITRPPRNDPGELEAFYRRVGIAYRTYARMGQHPAPSIAMEADVPVTTVHRWVREARRRGHLPPGRQGQVG
jgi:hypothetical protein